jgi:hypothetical protein
METPNFLTAEKFQVCQSAGKVMASVFWDGEGAIHDEFTHRSKQSMQKPAVINCDDGVGLLTQKDPDICREA